MTISRADEIPSREIRFLEWRQFAPLFRKEFEQGEHVTILGPNGSGKTTLALEVLEARDHVLFLATKRADSLIAGLSESGYRVSDDLDIRRTADGQIHREDRKFVFWPVRTTVGRAERHMDMREFRAYQEREIRRALNYVWRTLGWAVYADETLWLSEKGEGGLGLGPELNTIWHQGRSAGISLIASSQRPSWLPRAAYSAPRHLFFFQTSDKEDRKRLTDIGGAIDADTVGRVISTLGRYEFLYIRPRDNPPILLRSKVDKR